MNEMQFDTDLLQLLPQWYRDVLDYQQICATEAEQFQALAAEINAVASNFFFQTMDAGTVSQWEQIFGIVPDTVTETLAFRRARVLNRISNRPPFTLQFLYQKLNELIGAGQWTVTVDYPNYTLYVESAAQNQSYATEVAYTINHIKPAHIVYVNKPYVTGQLWLSESISLSQIQYNYNLGGWALGVLPFASETPQGVIKMPTTPSISTALLSGVANFVSGDVASAQINGTTSITELTKTVSTATLTVTYTVPQSVGDAITSVALLDSSGTVLTSSQVYVPITGNTVMTHTIPVVEGGLTNGS